jgi:Restriction endonuclease
MSGGLLLLKSSRSEIMCEPLSWRVYERVVAATEAEGRGIDFSVTPNARLMGAISGVERQVDILIDLRWNDEEIAGRTIVDAKNYAVKIDVKDVESFEGMMKDCRAARGILVCPNGYTPAAARRAQDAITIKLLDATQVDEFDWGQYDPCLGACGKSVDEKRRGMVLWDGQHLLGIGMDGMAGAWAVVFTGKCDRCHNFHAWCWDCGEKFALGDESEHDCECERKWVTAIEEETDDTSGETLNGVHFFMVCDEAIYVLDRRRLR